MEAFTDRSSVKVLMEHAVLAVNGFTMARRPGIFTDLNLHKMDVLQIGWEPTGVPDPGRTGWVVPTGVGVSVRRLSLPYEYP